MIPTPMNSDLKSPFEGQAVNTTGVVTAVNSGLGYYLQDPDGDDNPLTSDAIFVFDRSEEIPQIGDLVMVSGMVSEFYPGGASSRNQPTTQLGSITETTILASGVALPDPVILGSEPYVLPTESQIEGLQFWEALESMRVTVPSAVAVAGTNRFGKCNSISHSKMLVH